MDNYDLSHIWPEWQIEGPPLGSGAFGTVYKAVRRDNMVQSYAAIKVISIPKNPSDIESLRSDGVDLQEIVNGCVSEIQLMESLKGVQNIVTVEDYKVIPKTDSVGWDIYIRMELLTPLTSYIARHPLSQQEVIKLGCDICSALDVCSRKGIIHRDIKPENIFVNEFGDFKLGDFGIARKLERQQSAMSIKGTPNYMAPEVANSKDYDTRADIYSLGIVLYRYLNRNKLPFLSIKDQTVNAVEAENAAQKRLRGEKLPPPVDASSKMAEVILRACAYNPNARFQDASQMKQALQEVMDGISSKPRRRVGPIIAVISILAVLLGGAAALYFTGAWVDVLAMVQSVVSQAAPTDPVEELPQEQIDAIISQAETALQQEGYDAAIAVIEASLADHPDAQALQDKLNAYTALRQEQIVNDTLAGARELAEAQDYAAAIVFLQEAINEQGQLPEYVTACETYQDEYNRTFRAEALEEATRLAASEDYLNAILTIDEVLAALGNDEDLVSWRAELEVSYVNQVIRQADNLLLKEDYDGAEKAISTASKQFPENEQLRSEVQRIYYARPVYLLDEVSPYKKSSHYNDNSVIRMNYTNYLNGFTCMGYGEYGKGNQTYFNLDGKYSMISFTTGIIADNKQSVTFTFHADGELVGKVTMRSTDKPSNHTFNIVGCKQFKISVYDGSYSIDKSGTYGIADIVVKRNASAIGNEAPGLSENQVYLLDDTKPYIVPSRYEESSNLSMGGQTFAHGFSCMGYGEYNVGNKIYFNLDGKYSKMTFTAGIVLDRGLDVSYKFYTDGKLAYEMSLGAADLAETHSINVQGCKQLKILVYDRKQTVDASGTYGIANIIMDKSDAYEGSGQQAQPNSDQHYLLDVVTPHTTPTRYDDSNVLSMGGKHFTNGFSCMGYGQYNKGNQTYFTLDGKYSQISFTSGIVLDRGLNVTFRFLADGKLAYEFTMKEGDLPTEHSFSVEGCTELVVCVYDRQNGAESSGTYGLANIIVTEQKPE